LLCGCTKNIRRATSLSERGARGEGGSLTPYTRACIHAYTHARTHGENRTQLWRNGGGGTFLPHPSATRRLVVFLFHSRDHTPACATQGSTPLTHRAAQEESGYPCRMRRTNAFQHPSAAGSRNPLFWVHPFGVRRFARTHAHTHTRDRWGASRSGSRCGRSIGSAERGPRRGREKASAHMVLG
jgi:hypothetical protein